MSDRPGDASTRGQLVVPVQSAVPVVARAFEDAHRAHYRDLYRYLLALTGSPDEADEIAADTWERAYRSWDAAPDPALPWLLLTGRRIATDRWRRARRWASLALGLRSIERGNAGERRTEFWLWFDAVVSTGSLGKHDIHGGVGRCCGFVPRAIDRVAGDLQCP
jgi:hypothetical protein